MKRLIIILIVIFSIFLAGPLFASLELFSDNWLNCSPSLWMGERQVEYGIDHNLHSITDTITERPSIGVLPVTNKAASFTYDRSKESWAGRIIKAPGALDLRGFSRLCFKVAIPEGGQNVIINNFIMRDSNGTQFTAANEPITINTSDFSQEYFIDISHAALATVNDLFGFIVTKAENEGTTGTLTFYIDDITYAGGAFDIIVPLPPIIPSTNSITGNVYNKSGTPAAGVTVNLTGSAEAVTTTDTSGYYIFTGLVTGDYSVTPAQSGYAFSPINIAFSPLNATSVNNNFTCSQYYISGYVKDKYNIAISSVTLTLQPQPTAENPIVLGWVAICETDVNGYYTFLLESFGGNYSVTPRHEKYHFSPLNLVYVPLNTSVPDQNFTGEPNSISGHIKNVEGQGLSDIYIHLLDMYDNSVAGATSDANGYFEFTAVIEGTYKILPSITYYNFKPADRTVSLTDKLENIEFVYFDYNNLPYIKITGGAKGYINPSLNEKARIYISTNEELESTLHIKIYDIMGTLVWDTEVEATAYQVAYVEWPGRNNNDQIVASGIYLIHITGTNINLTKKVAIIK